MPTGRQQLCPSGIIPQFRFEQRRQHVPHVVGGDQVRLLVLQPLDAVAELAAVIGDDLDDLADPLLHPLQHGRDVRAAGVGHDLQRQHRDVVVRQR